MFYNNFYTLCNIGLMQFDESGNLALYAVCLAAWIIFYLFVDLIKGRVFCIILQHIKNKAFFNRLLHRVNVKSLSLALGVQTTKKLYRSRLRCGCKCKNRNICLLTISADFICNHILHITLNLLA